MVCVVVGLPDRDKGGAAAPTSALQQAARAASYQLGPQSQALGFCSADVYPLAESPTQVKLNFRNPPRRLTSFFPRLLLSSIHDSFALIDSHGLCTKDAYTRAKRLTAVRPASSVVGSRSPGPALYFHSIRVHSIPDRSTRCAGSPAHTRASR